MTVNSYLLGSSGIQTVQNG